MFTLVEPLVAENLVDRPDLGCAMLVGACKQAGIRTRLISGQTDYLKYMFVDGSEELWHLLTDLKDDDLEKLQIVHTHRFLRRAGMQAFRTKMKRLYEYLITDKCPRHYLDAKALEQLDNLHRLFIVLYEYYLNQYQYEKLGIVERYVARILKANPSYIGFSVYRWTPLHRAIRKKIKETTNIPIIVGGALTPFLDMNKLDSVFRNEYFDYLVIGQGEEALPLLIRELEDNRERHKISNVFYTEGSRVLGNDIEIIEDLDSLAFPDYSQFDLDLFLSPKRILPMQTARGCTWRKCAFCSHHRIYHHRYVTFSIDRVLETIAFLKSTYRCCQFSFHDEEIPPQRAKQISEGILIRHLDNISIDIYARPIKRFNNDELFRLMRRAGITSINWGMESACQRVIDLMNKGTDVSKLGEILRKCSESQIANMLFIIFGFPGETREELYKTVEFLSMHAQYIEDIMWGTFVLDLHSPIGEEPEKWGVRIKENGFECIGEDSMSSREVEDIFSSLEDQFRMNKTRGGCTTDSISRTTQVRMDKIRYLPHGIICRMMHFLNASYQLMSKDETLKKMQEMRFDTIFPILVGRIYREGNRLLLYPANIKKTVYINKFHPEKAIGLEAVEERVFEYSQGMLSIRDIMKKITNQLKDSMEKEDIQKKCLQFLQRMFSNDFALGYARSWNNPFDKNF